MNSNNGWGTAAQAHAAPPLAAKWQGLCTTVDPDRGTPGRLRGCMAAFNPTLQPPPFNLRLSTPTVWPCATGQCLAVAPTALACWVGLGCAIH